MSFNFGELDSVTEKFYLPTLVDQIYSNDPILAKIKQGKKVAGGGKAFNVQIKYDNLNHGKYAPNQVFPNTKKEIMNSVDIPIRGAFAEMVSDGFESAQNEGPQAIQNLLEEKLKALEEAMRIELLSSLYDDPAVTDPTNLGFIGLQVIVDDNNTYAGLDRSGGSHTYWRSIVVEDATNGVTLDGDPGYQILRKFFMDVTDGGKEGKNLVFVGDFGTVNKIEFMLASRNTITTVGESDANLGFASFKLFGKLVYASSELESIAKATGKGVLYALNFDFLTMYTQKGNDFRMTSFKEDQKNDLRIKQLLVSGNWIATKPSRLGVIRTINL